MVPDLNPITFGGRLREARERRGISLRQIANATKIAVAVLEALERNDISRLPGGIFGRAFVRSYAVEVGLDPERTIQEFITQFPLDSVVAGHPTSQVDVHVAVQNNDRRVSAVILVMLAGVVVTGWAVYFGAWRTLASHAAAFLTAQSRSDRRGLLANRPFHSRGVSETTSTAGWLSTRCKTSTR